VAGWVSDLVQLSAAGEPEHIAELRQSYEIKLKHPIKSKEIEWLKTREQIVKRCPHLANANIDGWQGIWNFKAGWGAANDAVDSVGRELKRFGVKMVFGPCVLRDHEIAGLTTTCYRSGTFDRPILDPATGRCVGVIAKDGSRYAAERVVMATGAWSPSLIDLKGQCVSKVSLRHP
jgi:sarcosine oxidase/L-pipecolate oxidase